MKKLAILPLTAVMFLLLAQGVEAGSISITSVSLPSSVSQSDSFTITVAVSGSDATSVSGSLTLPSGLSCTPTGSQSISLGATDTGSASWSCTASSSGDFTNQITVSVSATDSGNAGSLSDTEQAGLTVLAPASLTASSSLSSSSITTSGSSTFTVSVHNTGDESTTYSIAVSGLSASLASGSSSGTVSGSSIATATYTVSSSSAGGFTALATVTGGNSQTVTTSRSITVTQASSSSSSSGGGGGGGGGGGTTTTTNGTGKPTLNPGKLQGQQKLLAALEKVLAKGKMDANVISNLEALSEKVSKNIDYTLDFVTTNGTSTVTASIKNNGPRVTGFMVHDVVPKNFATQAKFITVNAPGATVEIVDEDPEFLIRWPELAANAIVSISYSINRTTSESIVSEFVPTVYAESIEEPPQPNLCGNDVCDVGETTQNCPGDCPLIVQTCTPGATQCQGSSLVQCNSEGTGFETTQVCEYGCGNNACAPTPVKQADHSGTMIAAILGIIILIIVAAILLFKSKTKKRTSFKVTRTARAKRRKKKKKTLEKLQKKAKKKNKKITKPEKIKPVFEEV